MRMLDTGMDNDVFHECAAVCLLRLIKLSDALVLFLLLFYPVLLQAQGPLRNHWAATTKSSSGLLIITSNARRNKPEPATKGKKKIDGQQHNQHQHVIFNY